MSTCDDKEPDPRVRGPSATERLLTPMALLKARSPHLWSRHLPPMGTGREELTLERYLFVGPSPQDQAAVARVGIFGAIHGDEMEGPLALGRFLRGLVDAPHAASGFFLHCYPVCNPTGLESFSPLSRRGKDLDREFWCGSSEPEVRLLEAELTHRAFDGIISLRSEVTATKFSGLVNHEPLSCLLLSAGLTAAETFLPVLRRVNGTRRFLRPGMLQSPPRTARQPFEIALVSPRSAPLHLQTEASSAAMLAILEEYLRIQSKSEGVGAGHSASPQHP